MPNITTPQILTGASIVVGFLLMVASAVFLDYIKPIYDNRNNGISLISIGVCYTSPIIQVSTEGCTAVKAAMGASALGLVASIVQILFGIFAVIKIKGYNTTWRGIHGAVFVLSIICFSIGIHFKKYYGTETESSFFYAMTFIDALFCVVAVVVSFVLKDK